MVLKDFSGDMQTHVCDKGDMISCDQFKQNKNRSNTGARDLYGFYGPSTISSTTA